MKKVLLLSLVFFVLIVPLRAQVSVGQYSFTEDLKHPYTPFKMQGNTGTCWSFATISFWESELIRQGKGSLDLAEMYVVRHAYKEKAANYILRQGSARFTQGGLAHDVIRLIDTYGIVPQGVYDQKGTKDGKYNHTELYNTLKAYVDTVIATQKRGVRVDWRVGVDRLLDRFFGEVPKEFAYQGKSYNAKSFAQYLGLKAEDYVTLTSFSHHPYYRPFILEVPDNWSNGLHYNLPLDELVHVLDYALDHGFTVEWDADTHNNGFSNTLGLAVAPQQDVSKIEKDKKDQFLASAVHAEKEISQTFRQQLFEDYTITDDHLMHITGRAKDQHGNIFYYTKNSSGDGIRPTKGYIYASLPYIRLHTISFMVHKDAMPHLIRAKLNL